MIALLLLCLSLGQLDVGLEYGKPERCRSTVFGQHRDKYAGGRALGFSPPRRVRPTDIGAAHRTMRIGTIIRVTNRRTQRVAYLRILDHGPYGRYDKAGNWYNAGPEWKARRVRPGRWAGCLDLTVAAAALLDHDGSDPVTVERVRLVVRWRVEPVVAVNQ